MSLADIFSMLGGVGLFLLGMNVMSTGLRNACGNNLAGILEKATKNKLIAILVGTGITVLIQSSSATDVMVIGFVNSGLMTLEQAIGVIMGANIGTTITAQITAFNLSTFTPLLLLGGAVLYLFISKPLIKHIGMVILGFGMLFQGITIMKAAIVPLSETAAFKSIITTLDNPALAVLFGIAFTALLQSSSSSTVIFQAFAIEGLLSYDICVYLVIGAAIGSVTPNLLAALTANRNGKRSAILNLLFNVFRAGLLLLLTTIIPQLTVLIRALSPDDIGRQIANTHTIFALIAVIVIAPFSKYIIKLARLIIPVKPEETEAAEERHLIYMSQMANIPPSLSIKQAHMEITRMATFAMQNLQNAIDCFFEFKASKAQSVRNREETVNFLNDAISTKIAELQGMTLTSEQMLRISMLTIALTDIKRLSDRAVNIIEYAEKLIECKSEISASAKKELLEMSEMTMETVELGIRIFSKEEFDKLPEIEELEEVVDEEERVLIDKHVDRLMNNMCQPVSGVVFSDIVTDFERCADHAVNIAYILVKKPLKHF